MSQEMTATHTAGWLSLLQITGDDRISFLQGQLTQDVAALSPDRPVALAASCDAKGRVLAVLTLVYSPDVLYAAVRRDVAQTWVEHVLRYRMRAKVDITPCDDRILTDGPADASLFDPRQPDGPATTHGDGSIRWQLGQLSEALQEPSADTPISDNLAWRKARLQAGIADIGPASSGSFTPHMLNLDRLSAISFSKGCYTGQEVVARTEHLGAVKRRAWLLRSGDGSALEDGASVIGNDRAVGRIAVSAGDLGLAVLSNDAAGAALTLEDGRALSREV